MNESDNFFERKQDKIKNFRLLDDVFMRACLNDNKEAVEYILQIIMDKPNLKVTNLTGQKDLINLRGRSIVADIIAVDDSGVIYNVEIDRGKATPKRLNYHQSIINTNVTKPGENFENIPISYVIFIMEDDPFKKGKPIYPVFSVVDIGEELISFDDGRYGLLVNGSYQGNDKIGKLMNDFRTNNVDEINSPILAKTVRYFKENNEGIKKLNSIMDDLILEGKLEGKKEERMQNILSMFKNGLEIEIVKKVFPEYSENELKKLQLQALEIS